MNNVSHNRNNISAFDTVELLSVYLEGYILTPVAILGIIGKILSQLIVALCSSIVVYNILFFYSTGFIS